MVNFDKEAAVKELTVKITKSQICTLAAVHNLNVEDVEDILQDMICCILDGNTTFDPARGKLEHWARATLACECRKAKYNRNIGLGNFDDEEGEVDSLLDFIESTNFKSKKHNSPAGAEVVAENDLAENPIWDNETARWLNKVHNDFELAGNELLKVGFSREGWAQYHGLTEKGGDQLADRIAHDLRERRAEGMEIKKLIELVRTENPACQRRRAPKKKKDDPDTVSVPEQPELF